MLLSHLLSGLKISRDYEILDIELNSKNIKPGGLFFALRGKEFDGAKFIPDAVKNGAVAVICSENSKVELPQNSDVEIIKVKNVYETLILALQKFYSNLPENILAVTGTNGKTSTAEFMRQMIEILGKKAASIGTVGIKTSYTEIQKKLVEFSLTTPDIVSLYKNLAILKSNGINDISIEASSIGIEQKRLAGLKISAGAFTNFTQDHLDYHGSMEKYFEAKTLLYKNVLVSNSIAVLNADIPEFLEIKKIAKDNGHQVFSYGKNGFDAKLINVKPTESGQEINFEIAGKKYFAKISMFGEFQVMNILCALLTIVAHYRLSESQIKLIVAHLGEIIPADGRMQKIATLKNGAKIFIDYAHSPDALLNVLENAEEMSHNHLHVLFGCGGDRDAKKRPIMGEIACEFADFVIVTDDNPRTENAENIRKEILVRCDMKKTVEIADRKKAIHEAISMLDQDDILIIAGKGHEKYQIIGIDKFPFDEEEIVREFTKNL